MNYAGAIVLVALIIGGGAAQGRWTDALLEVFMLPAVWIGLLNVWNGKIDLIAKWIVGLALFLLTIQFLPFSPGSAMPVYDGQVDRTNFWTISPSRSLQSALSAITLLGFASFVGEFKQESQYKILRFIMLGFAINLAVGIIQLSYSGNIENTKSILPHPITVGLFANQNHLAALVFMVTPIVAWRLLCFSWRPFVYGIVVTGMVAFLFAVDSRAGMVISVLLAAFSALWFGSRSVPAKIKILIAVAIGSLVLLTLMLLPKDLSEAEIERLTFIANTWTAIKANWLMGTGLGTFVIVYPAFEPPGDIIPAYVNHAHNDWLELLLEIGFVAFVPFVALFLLVLWRGLDRSPLHEAAVLSIGSIMLHSVVDFPLRSFAVGVPFAMLCGVVIAPKPENELVAKSNTDRRNKLGLMKKILSRHRYARH